MTFAFFFKDPVITLFHTNFVTTNTAGIPFTNAATCPSGAKCIIAGAGELNVLIFNHSFRKLLTLSFEFYRWKDGHDQG